MATSYNPGFAVEGEAKSEAQAFRSERNGPVPLSQVASIGVMSGVRTRPHGVPSQTNDFETLPVLCVRCSRLTPRPIQVVNQLRNPG